MKDVIIKAVKRETKLSEEEIDSLLEIPPSSELGDFAFPCFSLSKKHKKAPQEVSKDLAVKIKTGKEIERVEAKGPYVNFFLSSGFLAENTLNPILRKSNGEKKKNKPEAMVEFSQPNTHKAFHIGHVRGTSIGESLSRILEHNGWKVIRANYSGDTGMHIAKWIWCYNRFHKKEKLKDDEEWIASVYVDAVRRLEENEKFKEEVEEINRRLDSGRDKSLTDFWQKTKKLSVKSWNRIYKELNTHFDVQYFESEVEKKGKEIAKKLVDKKIAKISEGATIIDFKDHGEENLGVLVFLRKDGTALYAGKDLALAERKFKEYKLKRSYYAVGKAQELYIRQIFKTLELMKHTAAGKSYYVPFTEVRFPHGKMSSRTGDNVLYSSFRNELQKYAEKELKKRYDLDKKELEDRALKIAIASLKYSMLKQDPNKPIVFDPTESISFEGNTGPYLLYTYARARSIIRKSKLSRGINPENISRVERELLNQLSRYKDTVVRAERALSPNLVANYTFDLAKKFSEFYHSNKVIGSEEENFRLALVEATAITLKNALNLLGINVLESM